MTSHRVSTTLTALAAAWSCALLTPGPAAAGLVYSNGGPDFSGALVSDEDLPAQGAELFSVSGNPGDVPVVTTLRFWGSYLGGPLPATDRFRFTLSSSTNISQLLFFHDFAPGTVQRSAAPVGHWSHVNALGQTEQVPVYAYEAAMAVALVPNLAYYASVSNDTTGDAADWLWAFSGSGDGSALWRHHQAWWVDRESDFAFELLGPGGAPALVDEPAGTWLAALAALGLARRRVRAPRIPDPSPKGPTSMTTQRRKTPVATRLAATILMAASTASHALPAVQRTEQALPAVQRTERALPAVQAGGLAQLVLHWRERLAPR